MRYDYVGAVVGGVPYGHHDDYLHLHSATAETQKKIKQWIQHVIHKEGHNVGEINYVFCDDAYLNNINVKYLQHDTFTDVISFDYSVGKIINGDIFISVERVKENALKYVNMRKHIVK